jgi:nucleoid DNA-binding protein
MAKTAAAAAAPKKPLTKSELFAAISTTTEVPKKQVAAVLEALAAEVEKSLSKKGAGTVTVPGLLKIEKKHVPAKAAQKGVKNPFTGEIRDVPAKPASVKVKVRALKALKDMVK